MDKEKILNIARQLQGKTSIHNFYAQQAELLNLIEVYAGKNNSFYKAAEKVLITAPFVESYLNNIIFSFIRSVEQDMISKVSFERKIKIEVVNDYLGQAQDLLEQIDFHSAVSAVLIGASLEEYLRNWVIEQNLDFGKKSSIDSYAKALRGKDFITKQDLKDITAWSGLRNNAAHGNWELVADREKIRMMLGGVSLFIKQYS